MSVNESYVGETIEKKIFRVTSMNEPIEETSPVIYTPRNEGVGPEYNIRTDRFDIAVQAMDKFSKSNTAKREINFQERMKEKENAKGMPTEATKLDNNNQ